MLEIGETLLQEKDTLTASRAQIQTGANRIVIDVKVLNQGLAKLYLLMGRFLKIKRSNKPKIFFFENVILVYCAQSKRLLSPVLRFNAFVTVVACNSGSQDILCSIYTHVCNCRLGLNIILFDAELSGAHNNYTSHTCRLFRENSTSFLH